MGPSARIAHEDADLSDAMVYLNRIKEEYANDMMTYDNFLETMRDFKFGKIDAEEVCRAVGVLFKDKPHLIETFNNYLPSHLKLYEEMGPDGRGFDRGRLGASSPQRRGPYMGGGRLAPPPGLVGAPAGMHQQVHGGMALAANPHRGIHQGYRNQPLVMHSPARGGPGGQGDKQIGDARKLEEFEKMKARQAQDFIQRVKKRYAHNPGVYRSFVELLQSQQVKSGLFEKMKAEVNSLLWESPDLCEDFERNFVPVRRQAWGEEKGVLQRIKEVLKSKNVLGDFLKCINYFNQKFISEQDLVWLVSPLLGNEELVKGFKMFINYKEPPKEVPKDVEKYRKEGSYRILPEEMRKGKQDAIARETLNFACISCPTFESEDSNYVFLKRNVHEEALFRIEDERSEADMCLERVQYLINALEHVLETSGDGEISMRDIRMSPGIMKEVLKSIYDKTAPEILEGILMRPQIAIPIVIKRLYMVNKKLRAGMRERRKIWKEVVERNCHKALDVMGPSHKASEKSIFTMRNVAEMGESGIRLCVDDLEVMGDVMSLCEVYVECGQGESRRGAVPGVWPVVKSVFEKLGMDEFVMVSDFPLLCIFRFIALVYERLVEVKKMYPVESSADTPSESRSKYIEVRDTCLEFMRKNIDGYTFEDRIRELTECRGFKLYNMKKMVSKIEKQAVSLMESPLSLESLRGTCEFPAGEDLYCFRKTGAVIEVKAVGPRKDEEWDEYVEKFESLSPCEDVGAVAPFLPRTCRKPPITGSLKQVLKVQLSPGTYKLRYVTGSEFLYMNLWSCPKRR